MNANRRRLVGSLLIVWTVSACGGSAHKRETLPEEPLAEQAPPRATPRASTLVKEAETLLSQGDAQGARAKFQEAIAQDDHDVRAWLGLGLAQEELGDPKEAESAYRKALELDPGLAEAHNNLGLLLRDHGELGEAISELERALAADPKLASAQTNLALSLEEAGRANEADGAYRKAVALSPRDATLRANYGLFLLSQGQTEPALRELRAGLAQAQGNRAALVALGNGLRRAGKPDEAVRALQQAIAAGDGQPTPALLSELSLAQHAANDVAGAKASLEEALRRDPKYATAHYVLASLLASEGDLRGAADHYKRCIDSDPHGSLAQKAKDKLVAVKKAETK